MKQCIDIVNTAKVTYQYRVCEDRELVTCEACGSVVNSVELEQNYQIETHANVSRLMEGDIFEYMLMISNIGNTKDMVFIMDQLPKELQVMDITINTQHYPVLNQIYYGIPVGMIEPGHQMTVVVRIRLSETKGDDTVQMMTCNSKRIVRNKAFVYMKDCKDQYVFYESNEVCLPVVKRYCYPFKFWICRKEIIWDLGQICSIKQRLCSYTTYRTKNTILVKGCLVIQVTYCDCYRRRKDKIFHYPVRWCIPLEQDRSDSFVEDIRVHEITTLCWNYRSCRLMILARTQISEIR